MATDDADARRAGDERDPREAVAAYQARAMKLARDLKVSEAREAALREAIRKACATFDAAFKERTIGFFTASAIDDLLRRALAEHDARGGRKGSDGDVPAEM
jgi:hypothetical protein